MRELYIFHVVVPAGTTKAGAQTFNLSMPPRAVVEIEILIPPGPRGEVGFKIAQAGAQILPSVAGDFVVTDDETIHWPVEGANTSGAWQVIAYNTGGFAHTLEFRFQVNLAATAAGPGGPGGVGEPVIPATPDDLAALPAGPAGPGLPPAPELPAGPPPGVPLAPGPLNVAGPQAPPPPGLPAPPALAPLPHLEGLDNAAAVAERLEAIGQSNLQTQAALANQAALLDQLEAIGQAAHERSLGLVPAPPPPPGPSYLFI